MQTAEKQQSKIISAKSRKIGKVAVLGSGIMGSRIACHFANIGLQVVLLDIVPFNLTDEQKQSVEARNSLVNKSLKSALKSNPSPIYHPSFAQKIKTGNFDDDMALISACDWVIEVVIERLDIKKQVFEQVEKYRKPGTLITSNTSGIPIEMMLEGRSDDFKAHFCGTHFFNPPRYLKLFEVIPSTQTNQEVTDFLMHYGNRFLGKTTVLCKDTPAFIANRIGVFSIMAIFHLMQEMGMTVEEIDAVTGPVSGRPKSATFRTCDLVGIDTLVKVANGVKDNCPEDEAKALFETPEFLQKLLDNEWYGDKSGQGFYKKSKDAKGKRLIEALNLKTFEYQAKEKIRFESVGAVREIADVRKRTYKLSKGTDKAAEFYNKLSQHIFSYCSNRIPEISDEIYRLDDAVKAGFGWELGPFEQWDVFGLEETLNQMKEAGFKPAQWVTDMLDAGFTSFYKVENGTRKYFDISSQSYKQLPGTEGLIILDNLRAQAPVWKNAGTTIHDIGDGVLNVEFHTKMNSIGGEVLAGINKAIDLAEKDWKGVVIGNEAPNFSAGANIGMIFMLAIEQDWDEINFAISAFQKTVMRLRYSSIPTVIGPHGLTLGGGCEMTMHADAAVCAAETYIGLVEVGIGVIPGGAGTKEMVLRASDSYYKGDAKLPQLQERFINIATAKVATSGHEAYDIGVLDKRKDSVQIDGTKVITDAKQKVIELYDAGYVRPVEREDIEVLGRTALGGLYAGAESFHIAAYASEHDRLIAKKLAWIMCGGDLSAATKVNEQYLLDLEREAFLSLLGERKTLERIQSVLKTGRPVRN